MSNKKPPEMIAEALREIGVLAIALVPIDVIFALGAVHWGVIFYALGAGFLFLILGMLLETIR